MFETTDVMLGDDPKDNLCISCGFSPLCSKTRFTVLFLKAELG